MSSISLSYNGFSDFSHVRIGRFEHMTDAGPDKPQRGITRHLIEGEAIIKGTGGSTSSVSTKIADLTARLNRNGRPLTISWIGPSGGTSENQTLVDISGGDDSTGPFATVRITEIVGTNMALVAFAFEWFQTYGATETLSIVREFVMTARFNVDQVGQTTMTRTGYITLRKSAAAASTPPVRPARPAFPSGTTSPPWGLTSAQDRADIVPDYPKPATGGTPLNAFPDEYRRLIAGNLLRGFRRAEQEYATDESRNRMLFTVVDREAPRGMPGPARVGECNFRFERQMPSGGSDANALGVKTFEATLSAGPDVAPVDLLALAIRLSQNRILFNRATIGGVLYEPDLIQRIAVTELDMLNSNTIRFEIVATATSTINWTLATTVAQSQPWKTSGLLGNILTSLDLAPSGGTAITFTFTPTSYPDAYGTFGVYRVTPNHYDPELSEAEKTWNTTRILAASQRSDVVYEFPDAFFDAVVYTAADATRSHAGRDNAKNRKDTAAAGGTPTPYIRISANEVRQVDTNMTLLSAQDLSSADIPFQVRKPRAILHQRMTAVRMNAQPEPQFNPPPAGSVLLYEMPEARSGGTADVNGNRLCAAVFERVWQVPDAGGTDAGQFFNRANGSLTLRQAWPHGSAGTTAVELPSLATRDVTATGAPTNVGDEAFRNATRLPLGYVQA